MPEFQGRDDEEESEHMHNIHKKPKKEKNYEKSIEKIKKRFFLRKILIGLARQRVSA